MDGLKPVPFRKATFSAACKVVPRYKANKQHPKGPQAHDHGSLYFARREAANGVVK
jgi:hypothetical protein